jgi:hypothetical protein
MDRIKKSNNKTMGKQTAIEWLQECLSIHLSHQQQMQFEGLFQQAKAMEREQMNEIHIDGIEQGYNMRYQQEKKMQDGKDV